MPLLDRRNNHYPEISVKEIYHLLIVDDHDLSRELMVLHLKKDRCRISEAVDGKEALKLIEEHPLDLILLDFDIPNMNGLEVLTHIRTKFSPLQLPVIMVTAHTKQEDILKAFQLGVNDYLLKPINYEITEARIRTQLAQSYLLHLKDNFIQFARHDLKKPLFLINDICQSLHENLVSKYNIDDDSLEMLSLIQRTLTNTQEMITGFLDENNQQTNLEVNQQKIDINEILTNLSVLNAKYCKLKNISLQHNLTKENYQLFSVLFSITQILDNLIGNAIKFSPDNTTIEISSRIHDHKLLIEIKDQGPGIPEDEFHLLFKQHARLSNKPTANENSTGIGLALCKELAQQINATVGAYNNDDKGATFYLELTLDD